MRLLITGAAGFIGGHLVRHLAGAHEVIALVRRTPSVQTPGVHYVEHDLSRPLVADRLPAKVDAVVHQAAVIDTGRMGERTAFAVNVQATWELLTYAQRAAIQTFVYASTDGVYGCRNSPFVERDPLRPLDFYSLTKAQAELAFQAAPGEFHRVVLRYFFPYGVGTPNPIPQWVQKAVTGAPLPVLRSGKPALNPLHVSDAVEATVRALYLDESVVLNIAGVEITSFGALATLAAEFAGRTPNFAPIADESAIPYYRADLVADISVMQRTLSFTPAVDLAAGVRELVDYYRAQQ